MVIPIKELEAELANMEADAFERRRQDRRDVVPTLVSLLRSRLPSPKGGKRPVEASAVLPVKKVLPAIIKAHQNLAFEAGVLPSAQIRARAELDRICETTVFTLRDLPGEQWIRLTLAEAEIIDDCSQTD